MSKLATENSRWGYTKIRDALRTGLGIEIGRTTAANILANAGIEPTQERKKKRNWNQFIKAHWDSLSRSRRAQVPLLPIWTKTTGC